MEKLTDMVEKMLVVATDVTVDPQDDAVDHLISEDVQAAVAHETKKMADRMN